MAIRYYKKKQLLVFTGQEAEALEQASKECGKTPQELTELAVRQLGFENVLRLAETKKKRRK